MYPFVLTLHNITRWLVLILAVIAIARSFSGLSGKKKWSAADDRAGMLFTMLLDIQLLLGLILYFFLSPTTTGALSNFGAAMGAALVRYFAVEHSLGMLVAVVVAHLGRSASRRAHSDRNKFRRAAIWFTLALVIILVSIPWPFMAAGRPWFRLGGMTF